MKYIKVFLAFGFITTFYSFALESLRIKVGGLSLPPPILFLFCLALLSTFRVRSLSKPLLVSLFLLSVFIAITIFSGVLNDVESAIFSLFKYVFCLFVFISTYFSVYSYSKQMRSFFVYLLVFSAGFTILHMLNSYFILKSTYLSGSLFLITEVGKNQVAAYLSVLSSLNLCFIFLPLTVKDRIIVFVCFILHLVALLYTYSRSAQLSFIVGLLVLVVRFGSFSKIRMKFLVKLIFFGFFGGIALVYCIPTEMVHEFLDNFYSLASFEDRGDSTSLSVRTLMIEQGIQMFSQAPIIGNGPYSFYKNIGIASHNTYIQLVAEYGLLGLLSFLAFVIHTLYAAYRNNIVLLSSLVCLYVAMIFQNISDSMFAYMIIGAAIANMKHYSISKDVK